MCLIIWRRKGTAPISEEYLERSVKRNPHGWGMAFMNSKQLSYIRSMDMKNVILNIRALEGKDVEFLVHMRFATHGSVSLENAHPFNLNSVGLLMHNGKMKDVGEWAANMSDTWHFGQKFRGRLLGKRQRNPDITIQDVLETFEKSIGDSRVAIMDFQGKVHIYGDVVEEKSINTSTWVDIDGNLFSNRYSIEKEKQTYTKWDEDWYWDKGIGGYTTGYRGGYGSTTNIYRSGGYTDKKTLHEILDKLENGTATFEDWEGLYSVSAGKLAQQYPITAAKLLHEKYKEGTKE